MRHAVLATCALAVILLQITEAQTPARPAPAQRPTPPEGVDTIPVRRVILYKNGIGYFEHVGKVRGNETVTVAFNSSQLNDVLKTLTTLDLGSGRVTGVSYNSEAPLAQRLGGLRLPVGEHATLAQLLDALRGARLEVHSGDRVISGRLLSVEQRTRTRNSETAAVSEMTLVSDGGDIRVVEITPAVTVRLAERDSTQQVGAYMGLLASSRARDQRLMKIATAGTGERDLLVSYISEVPVWKTTYRIVLPSRGGAPQLQAWAIVDNTIGEDWRNVELSLVAGAPQSFLQQISQPLYAQRPVVPLPKSLLVTPQTHQGTLTSSAGGVSGRVTDASGANLPGVTVSVTDENGRVVGQGVTDADGEYEFGGVLPGRYAVVFDLVGFSRNRRDGVSVDPGLTTEVDATLSIGSVAETVTVAAERGFRQRITGVSGGAAGGVIGQVAAPARSEIEDRIGELTPAAQGHDLGDLFEYRITEPISIPRNQSALVPILRHEVGADRVSVWNSKVVDGRPLRSLWLTNSSGSTLDGGSFSVLDAGAFAGEGIVEPMKPGEKRLLSYAIDLGVQVEPRNGDERRTVTRITIGRGLLVQHNEHQARRVYTIRNNDTSERRVVIEHPIRAGWKLTSAATPAETSTDAYRFIVAVPAKKTETFAIAEQQPVSQTYRIADISDQQVELIVRESGGNTALRSALAPILAAKAALSALNAEFNGRAAETKRIADDQQRVRENMKTLRGSSEEQQLLKRYTAQLAQQEDRMEALRKESDDLERRRRDAQAELARLIDSLTTDVAVTP
jgi:hypothetical protein